MAANNTLSKFIVYDWGFSSHILKKAGFESGKELPIEELYSTINKLLAANLNIMIFKNNGQVCVATDTKKFQQR